MTRQEINQLSRTRFSQFSSLVQTSALGLCLFLVHQPAAQHLGCRISVMLIGQPYVVVALQGQSNTVNEARYARPHVSKWCVLSTHRAASRGLARSPSAIMLLLAMLINPGRFHSFLWSRHPSDTQTHILHNELATKEHRLQARTRSWTWSCAPAENPSLPH